MFENRSNGLLLRNMVYCSRKLRSLPGGVIQLGFQIIAVCLLLTFYGCYFAKMIGQKRRGIQTDQIGKGKVGFVKAVEVTMKVATFLVPLAELASIFWNTTCMPTWIRILGAVIGSLGVITFICAVLTMRDSWRAGVSPTDRTELVTAGIFQISRNPAFLGFDLVYIGLGLMFFNWGLWAVSAFAALMFHLQIVNVEEVFLQETFGEDYLAYCADVRRYLGRRRKRS